MRCPSRRESDVTKVGEEFRRNRRCRKLFGIVERNIIVVGRSQLWIKILDMVTCTTHWWGMLNKRKQMTKKDFLNLQQWASNLLAMTDEIGDVSYSENDHFGFMALSFLGRQKEHMKSILILNESLDVLLIARSMIEGLFQLIWAAKDPDNLGLQWRAYVFVQDWRTLKAKISAGESVDSKTCAMIKEGLHRYGDLYLKSKAREKREKSGPQSKDDQYRKSWTGLPVLQIGEKVKGELLYEHLYRPFSDYQHWNPGGLGTSIRRDQNLILYSPRSPEHAARALKIGFQCLLQILEIVDKHFELDITARLAELRDGYIAWHQTQHISEI